MGYRAHSVCVCGIPVPKEVVFADSFVYENAGGRRLTVGAAANEDLRCCENVPANEATKNAGGSGPLKSPLPTKLCECAQFEELKRCKEDNQLRLGMCV